MKTSYSNNLALLEQWLSLPGQIWAEDAEGGRQTLEEDESVQLWLYIISASFQDTVKYSRID